MKKNLFIACCLAIPFLGTSQVLKNKNGAKTKFSKEKTSSIEKNRVSKNYSNDLGKKKNYLLENGSRLNKNPSHDSSLLMYCTNETPFICYDGDVINNVTFAGINNNSDCSNEETGYSDYTTSVGPASVKTGNSFVFSVKVGSGFDYESVGVWIDYNQNGVFDDNEYTFIGSDPGSVLEKEIAIPQDALLGNTRMRVVVSATEPDAFSEAYKCGPVDPKANFGEMEDYTVNIASNASLYCINEIPFNCADGDVIKNVTFAGINNDSECGDTNTGYSNYKTTVAAGKLTSGKSFNFSAKVGPSGDGWQYESVGVWIDYNQNGVFDDNEYTYVGTGLNEVLSKDIVIPSNALVGDTRMRVVLAASGADNFSTEYKCGPIRPNYNYGEMEDYTVNIVGGSSEYCINDIPFNCDEGDIIKNVTFAGINNDSECGDTNTGYSNYTTTVAAGVISAGNGFDFSVKVGPSGDGWQHESVGVWIDYNQNGIFDDSEYTFIGTGLDEVLNKNIVIPSDAILGNTRMRVVLSAAIADVFSEEYRCGPLNEDMNYGEMEDYTVNIVNNLGVNDINKKDIKYYPNPVRDVFNIESPEKIKSVKVFDSVGKQILTKELNQAKLQIDFSKFSLGVYIITIVLENGTSTSTKVVKK